VEAAEAALFARKSYVKFIDGYFHDAPFIKLTGDGLLIVHEHEENKGTEVACNVLETCLKAVKDFGSFFADDEYFSSCDPPNKIGIGMSMGPVGAIVLDGKVLDYCGRFLNLASRLMAMARPSGIVVDDRIGRALLMRTDLKRQFKDARVFPLGINESIKAHYTENLTSIPRIYLRPLEEYQWATYRETHSLAQWKKMSNSTIAFDLKKKLADPDLAAIDLLYPESVRRRTGFVSYDITRSGFKHNIKADKDEITLIGFKSRLTELAENGVKDSDRVPFVFRYPVKP
jgi:hypothetical protein